MVSLCIDVDPKVPESENVKDIIKEIWQQAFQLVPMKSSSTVNEGMSNWSASIYTNVFFFYNVMQCRNATS